MGAITIPDSSHLEDERHEAKQQRLLEAEREGYRAGALGLGAGLCSELCGEEEAAWRKGFAKGQRDRRRAA